MKIDDKYIYEGKIFRSSLELCYWIYCKDHNIDIIKNKTFCKMSNGKYIKFSFKSDGRYVDIKRKYITKFEDWPIRMECYLKYDVKLLFEKDVHFARVYVFDTYGKKYLQKFRIKHDEDFKRKVIEVTPENLQKYKNKNVKFHYKCSKCGADVYTSYRTVNHFKDGLCKHCRKNYIVEESSTN